MTRNTSVAEQEHYLRYVAASVPLDKAIQYAREDAAAELAHRPADRGSDDA